MRWMTLLGRSFVICVCAVGLFAGCSDDAATESADVDVPDWVSEDNAPGAADAPDSQLALRLKPGERFPLRKVIEREVVQTPYGAAPQTHRLRIELTLGMTVQEVRDGRTKFQVRYDRVRYNHQMPDEVIEYDSANAPQQLPLTIQAWHAMVGDGFNFWIGKDNQIAEVEGFREFIDRCLSVVPEEHRQEVLLSIESSSGENGVSDFVDNAIGLLPYGEEKQPGETWERDRHIGRPVPMHLHSVYTLKELTADKAVVRIDGEITPSTTIVETRNTDVPRVRMTVRQGNSWGTCTLYRSTGLPQHSQVEHEVLMTVHMSGGETFDQRVRGVTTLEAFPAQSTGQPMVLGADPNDAAAR
ncbi:MAG: DUF6263 family protein [Planctomycetaceae bacterium]